MNGRATIQMDSGYLQKKKKKKDSDFFFFLKKKRLMGTINP
jgi:hypothetical protein